jgi:hypothetical protein
MGTAATMSELRAAHRRKRLLEVAREVGPVTTVQLRDHARYEGLETTLEDCGAVLAEVYPPPPPPARPAPGTQAELVLAAAATLEPGFSKAALVVAAWRAWPQLFGLKGFHFPDANKVLSYLYGKRGLLARGLVTRQGLGFRVAAADAAPEAGRTRGRRD